MTNLSPDFSEQLILLILTAAITGFFVPLILKWRDERKLRGQKAYEAQLARQGKIIESQVALLENLAKQLWEFQLLALTVSYYKSNEDDEKYRNALQEYDAKAWSYFGSIRIELSKAQRLTNADTYQMLHDFYRDWLIEMDANLMALVKNNASVDEWRKYHSDFQTTIGEKTDAILNRLSEEFHLGSVKK